MFTKSCLLAIVVSVILIVGCEGKKPQARLEQDQLACSISASFKTTLDQYFKDNPPDSVRAEPWCRAFVLQKNREFRTKMHVTLMLYLEGGETRVLETWDDSDAGIDLNTPVGGIAWFKDVRHDKYVVSHELEIITEQAVCIPDSLIIENFIPSASQTQ